MILKEGAEDSSGRGQIISNINACQAVVDVVKTTLGLFGVLVLSTVHSGDRGIVSVLSRGVVFSVLRVSVLGF